MSGKTETNYQLAQPVVVEGKDAGVFKTEGTATAVAVGGGQKQGHKCCGGCCDVRRAVIVVNAINIVLLGLSLFSILATQTLAANATGNDVDDQVQEAMEAFSSAPLGAILAIMGVQMVLSAVGIAGAVLFNKWMVIAAAIAYGIGVAGGLLSLNPGGLVFNACFLYPHIFLIKEIRDGIMSKENYPNEQQSCCCV